MENKKSQFCSKRVIIACVSLISILILCGFILSILICKNPILWYEVEYINCNSNVLVQTYQKGQKLSLPDNPERVGHKFVGWSLDEGGDSMLPADEVVVNNSFTLYAQWQEFEYKIKYNSSNILSFKNSIRFIASDANLEIYTDSSRLFIIENPSKVGYTFDCWKVMLCDKVYDIINYDFDKDVLEDIVLMPTWQRNVYSVEVYSDNSLFDTIGISYGDTIDLPSISKDGYRLLYYKDELGNIIDETYVVESNKRIFAVWEEIEYTISFSDGNGTFIINCSGENFSGNRNIKVKYLDFISFGVSLSKAYDKSDICVYAKTDIGVVYPEYIDGLYVFNNISNNLKVVINNVTINTYTLNIDGKDYGKVAYGSWLLVENE